MNFDRLSIQHHTQELSQKILSGRTAKFP